MLSVCCLASPCLTAASHKTSTIQNSKRGFGTPGSSKQTNKNGSQIDEECPNEECGNDMAYYRTMQLRSADEGQTIFYTCTKCRHKWKQDS